MLKRFLHHAFAGKRRVAVDQQSHRLVAVLVVGQVLLGPHAAQGHGIDEFQMAGVEAQREVDLLTGFGGPIAGIAQVVLDVAAAQMQFGIDVGKLAENVLALLCMMLASTLSRPRWAMPSTISLRPCSPAFSIVRSSSGIKLSAPSSENRLEPRNRFWMNSSNSTALGQPP